MNEQTLYNDVGGDAPFIRLIDAFYEGVEQDPLLRPMYPEDLTASRRHMLLFVTQYFGAPARYNALRGHPRLRMRHMPFTIGQAERDAWFTHMSNAIDKAGFPAEAVPILRGYFNRAATFLINSDHSPNSIELLG